MTAPDPRAEGYQLLALALGYPAADELNAAFAAAAALPPLAAHLALALAPLVDAGLPAEYNRLFTQSVAVSPYETDYVAADKGARLGQLATLYEAFGVRAGGEERENVDHIGAQLEFAALLCVKERRCADAGARMAEPLAITRRARQVFLEEHLGTFGPAFTARLAERALHPYYQRLAALCAAWIDADLRAHGWVASSAAAAADDRADDGPLVCPIAPPSEERP